MSTFPRYVKLLDDIPMFDGIFRAGTIAEVHSVTLGTGGRMLMGLTGLHKIEPYAPKPGEAIPIATVSRPPWGKEELAIRGDGSPRDDVEFSRIVNEGERAKRESIARQAEIDRELGHRSGAGFTKDGKPSGRSLFGETAPRTSPQTPAAAPDPAPAKVNLEDLDI